MKQFLSNHATNTLGQPIGHDVPNWTRPPRPARIRLEGRFCDVVPLEPEVHGAQLFEAHGETGLGQTHARQGATGDAWVYSPEVRPGSREESIAWATEAAASEDPLYYAIVDKNGRAVGSATFMRIDPNNGSIEVGTIKYSPVLQRTTAATEAMVLMMRYAFSLGYRRYEWKCDSLNTASRQAAMRLGFAFEGLFRQTSVYKGRNRDTSWFSILDNEWPTLEKAYETWLAPDNFDAQGQQKQRLSVLTRAVRAQFSEQNPE